MGSWLAGERCNRPVLLTGRGTARRGSEQDIAKAGLVELEVSGNHVTDLGPLVTLTDLSTLSLDDNPVRDPTPFGGLQHIASLKLRRTAITKLAPLAANQELRSYSAGRWTVHPAIHVEENPQLDCAAESEHLAALRARGADVYTDCPLE